MDQKEAILTVEQLQKILLDAEKSGEYLYEELLPIWEEAKGVIEDEQQMVSLYTTFIYLTRRFAEREQSSPNYSTVEELFNEGSNFLDECFEGYSDAGIRFEKNFAFFSYTKLKKTEKAREIWNKLLEGEQSAFPWLEAIALERAYGDIEYARCLFFKALDAVTYRQQEIFGRFVQFEREEGTRDQLDLALARVNAKAAEYNAWTKQQQLHKNHPKTGRTKETGEQKTTKKRDKKEKAKGKKGREEKEGQRKTQKGEEDDKPEEMEAGEESKATIPNGQPPIDGHDIEGTSATFETYSVPLGPVLPGNARPVDLKNKKDKVTKQKEGNNERTNSGMAGEKRKRPPSLSENYFPYNVGLEKNKLFVKKLDWSCTGEELKKFFEKFGAVVDARIVTKWNGRSKGCAYVDFADEQSASAALMGADGAEIKGRKISVFLSNPPPAKKAKFSTTATEDKNVATHENISDANTGSQVEREQKQRVKQQKMASGLMPRVAFLTGAGQRVGKASRLMLPTNVISKNRIAETEAKNESPVGIVTESTKEMTL